MPRLIPEPSRCALHDALPNSKIVVVRTDGRKRPVLMTPDGEQPVETDDVAWTLPEGARITKEADDAYVAVQLDHNRDVSPLSGPDVRDVIARFHQHFHG